ncbi:unnamed protein product [Amoebophrya sp. A25]|nr:unnamed protein product [Amoebophrya sp. A25]|eukprot:GSA25T00015764001.1
MRAGFYPAALALPRLSPPEPSLEVVVEQTRQRGSSLSLIRAGKKERSPSRNNNGTTHRGHHRSSIRTSTPQNRTSPRQDEQRRLLYTIESIIVLERPMPTTVAEKQASAELSRRVRRRVAEQHAKRVKVQNAMKQKYG